MDKSKNKRKEQIRFFSILLLVVCVAAGVFSILYTQITEEIESSSRFSNMFADYDAISDAIGDPVSNPTIPTIGQVIRWLHFDDTNDANYIEDVYMCGDFAVDLTISAKGENWRIYVIGMYYSFEDGEGYGVTDLYGDYGHAFNMIKCVDGNDVGTELDIWYIEPQTDTTWQLNYNHYVVYTYYSGLSGTVWDTTYWINYYDYLG